MRWVHLATVVTVVALISGCGMDRADLADEIPIGVNIELTGRDEGRGLAFERALSLVVAQINQTGILNGQRIRLITRDNKSDPAEAIRVATDLIETDRVVAMIGGGTTATTLPLVDLVTSSKVPTISMGESADITTPIDRRRYLFKTPANEDAVLNATLSDMQRHGTKRIAFLVGNDENSSVLMERYEAFLQQKTKETNGISLLAKLSLGEDNDSTTSAFSDLLDPPLRSGVETPDTVVIIAPENAVVGAATLVKQSGFTGSIYLGPHINTDALIAEAGDTAEGVRVIHSGILGAPHIVSTTPSIVRQKEFYAQYTGAHGAFSGYASYAADALGLVVAALKKAGVARPDAVRDALEDMTYDGLTGTFEWSRGDHNGVRGNSLGVLAVHQGAWVPAG